jgi:two-component system sensor histidine kinase/response regulator
MPALSAIGRVASRDLQGVPFPENLAATLAEFAQLAWVSGIGFSATSEKCVRIALGPGCEDLFVEINPSIESEEAHAWLQQLGLQLSVSFQKSTLELELANSEEQFLWTFEHAPIGKAMVTEAGRYSRVNRAFCEMLGYSEAELCGMRTCEVIHPDDLDHKLEMERMLLQGSATHFQVEKRYFRKDGQIVWGLLSASVLCGMRGNTVCLVEQVQDISHRVAAEQRLRQERDFRFRIENSLSQGIVLVSHSGEVLYVNPGLCHMVGFAAEELVGQTSPYPCWSADLHTTEKVRALLRRGLEQPATFELTFRHQNGTPIDVVLTVTPTEHRHESQPCFLASVFDITMRKRSERALATSEERFRLLAQNVPGAIFRWVSHPERPSEVVFLSSVSLEIFERSTMLEAHEWAELLWSQEDSFSLSQAALVSQQVGFLPFQVEIRIAVPSPTDGRRAKWVRILCQPTPQSDGSICWDGFVEDIGRRKQAEVRLRESEQRYAALAATIPVGAFRATSIGEVIWVNQRCQEIAGVPIGQLLGYAWDQCLHPDDRERVRAWWNQTLNARTPNYMECRFVRPHGEVRWVYMQAEREFDESNQVSGYVGSITDITRRKATESLLEAARLAAEAANRAKGDFLATMSHEIRTPMNAIIGLTGLLLDSDLDERQRDFCETIQQSGDHLLTLISDILDYSKIEAGRMELEQIHFEPRRVMEEVLDLISAAATTKELELVLWVEPGTPATVCGDPGRLRQIALNLVSNAIKFTPSGGVIELRVLPQEAERIRFEVRDCGIGMSGEQQSKLFQPFCQGDSSTTRKSGGTGLGLSICKRLVELMGGSIDCSSAPGDGSTFWFTVPLPTVYQDVDSIDVRRNLQGRILKKQRLLLTGSHSLVGEMVIKQCGVWGLSTEYCPIGEAVSTLCAATEGGHPFTLVIVDCWVAEKLRELVRGNELGLFPTPHYLALGWRNQLSKGLAGVEPPLPFVVYLSKPVKSSELLVALMAILRPDQNRLARTAASPQPSTSAVRLLVAEDNATNQKVLRYQLRGIGHRADFVANGLEALQALERHRDYALILMDCQMPEMDGLQATREIRRREHEQGLLRIPIIALTAGAFREDRDNCLAAGMDHYLSKPVRDEDLRALIETYVYP